jgi:peptidoglycan hydrolase CwlO-like protein
MKIFRSSLMKITIAMCLSFVLAAPVEASSKSNISNQISDINEQKKNTEANINDAKNKVDNLESAKNKLQTYLEDLNSQLMELSEQLENLGTQITSKEEEITTTKQELEEAKAKEEKQYEDMKTRIKFMYENGDTAYLQLFLEAESLSDALNKAEYIMKIYDYDRDMLTQFKETKDEITEKEALLVEEQNELYSLQDEVEEKQQQVAEVVASTSTKISSYSSEIADTEKKAKEYEAKLSEQNNKLENLQKLQAEQKAAADKAAKEKAAKEKAEKEAASKGQDTDTSSGSSSGTTTPSSAGDLAMLAAIIQCESGGESMEGKLAVGSVVMNRVRSSSYPNTIVGVIYQSGQFTPVASGRFALVLAQGATSSCVSAAQQVLNGYSSGSWLQFRTVNSMIDGTVIGNHVFF